MRSTPFEKTTIGREILEKLLPEALRELKRLRIAAERIAIALEEDRTSNDTSKATKE